MGEITKTSTKDNEASGSSALPKKYVFIVTTLICKAFSGSQRTVIRGVKNGCLKGKITHTGVRTSQLSVTKLVS